MRTQSSKNVQKGKDGNKKHNRNAKSAKNVKIQVKYNQFRVNHLLVNNFISPIILLSRSLIKNRAFKIT